MVVTDAGVVTATAEAAAAARIGLAMMIDLMVVVVAMEEGTMIGNTSLKRGAGKEGAAALAGEEEGAGALVVVEGTEARRGKAVLREGPKLNNGTGSGSKLQVPVLLTITTTITIILMMAMQRMVGITLIDSKGDTAAIEDVVCSSSPFPWFGILCGQSCIRFHFQ